MDKYFTLYFLDVKPAVGDILVWHENSFATDLHEMFTDYIFILH
jgi:hypothetical protein